jgi:chemotaxis protein CheD
MVLGSCVSVCLYDRIRGTGGANHYVIARWGGRGEPTDRYGDVSIPHLIDAMVASGSRKSSLVAGVYGGGELLDIDWGQLRGGETNAEVALSLLGKSGIPVVARDLGGRMGRRIAFESATGNVTIRPVARIGALRGRP